MSVQNIKEHGFYKITEEYFNKYLPFFGKDFNLMSYSAYYARRPFYCLQKDENGIIWAIPLSGKIEKYSQKQKELEQAGRELLLSFIGEGLNEQEVYKVNEAIPVTESYLKPYSGSNHKILRNREVRERAEKMLKHLLSKRRSLLKLDIDGIVAELLKEEREPVRKVMKRANKGETHAGDGKRKATSKDRTRGYLKKQAIEEMRKQDYEF